MRLSVLTCVAFACLCNVQAFKLPKSVKKLSVWAADTADKVKGTIHQKKDWTSAEKKQLNELSVELAKKGTTLVKDEKALEKLSHEKSKFEMEHLTWFLNKGLYAKHETMVQKINAIHRKLDADQEEMDAVFRKVKGLNGVVSMLFAEEMAFLFLSPFLGVIDFVMTTFITSLFLSLFFFVPTAAMFTFGYSQLSMIVIPFLGIAYTASIAMKLPGRVLEYHPEPPIFAGILVVSYFILYQVGLSFVPRMRVERLKTD